MNKLKKMFGFGIILGLTVFTSGCKSITPPAYDVGLKSKTENVTYETGGQKETIPVKIDNKKYQDLSKENQDYLSYHLYSSEGELLRFDNTRTEIQTIPARGKGTVDLEFRVPMLAGNYTMEVDLVKEGVSWYSEQGNKTLKIPITVLKDYVPEYKTQISVEQDELTVDLKEGTQVTITIKNLGTVPVYADGDLTPVISYHLYDENSDKPEVPVFEGPRYKLDQDIHPGEEETFSITLNRVDFQTAGRYRMVLDLVQEGTCWYADKGAQTAEVMLVVK